MNHKKLFALPVLLFLPGVTHAPCSLLHAFPVCARNPGAPQLLPRPSRQCPQPVTAGAVPRARRGAVLCCAVRFPSEVVWGSQQRISGAPRYLTWISPAQTMQAPLKSNSTGRKSTPQQSQPPVNMKKEVTVVPALPSNPATVSSGKSTE